MKKTFIIIIFIIFYISGCSTITENVIETTIGSEDYRKIEEIDLLILEYRIKADLTYLDIAENKVKEMLENKLYNKEYEAILYGLSGEIAYFKGNQNDLKKCISEIEIRSKYVEYYYILKSLQENDTEKKIEILEQGINVANSSGKIKLYLALIYFENREFGKATAYFDDAFDHLNQKYKEHYMKDRNLAEQLMKNPDVNIQAKDLLKVEAVSFSDVISLTLLQTDFLSHITVKKNENPASLLEILQNKGYIHGSISSVDGVCARKDVAYFLLGIISYLENDPNLKVKYQKQYNENQLSSPVPDVPVEEYYFNAVLVLVEKEIMELPNGIHFLPYKTVSGIEFNELLNKIKDKYY